MAEIKKVAINLNMESHWQKETYEWVKQQAGDNESGFVKSLLYHLYLKSKDVRAEGIRIVKKD